MRQIAIIVALSVVLALACVSWMASEAAAEPIPGTNPAASAGEPAQTQMPEITDALARFKERDYEGTLKLLKQAAQKNSELPPANLIMAQLFAQANIPGGVRNALERAVSESPDDPEPYLLMANIAMSERRQTEARLLYEKAGSLIGNVSNAKRKGILHPQVLSGLATTCEARGDWAGALRHLEAWLKLDPKSTAALQQMGQCLFQQKDEKGALAKFKEAYKIDPELLPPAANLAQLYARTGDQANAKKWMVAALTEAPKDFKTRMLAAQWALETSQPAEAEKQAAIAMQLDPKSLDAMILRGVINLFLKNYKAAEMYFEAASLQSPKNFAATNNLALALIEQDNSAKKQRALEYAEKNLQQYPKSSDAASTYGWVCYKFGKLDEAEKALRASASGGLGTDTAYFLACVFAERGNSADAKKLLESALKSTLPFRQREEAQAMLDKLKKADAGK